MPTRDRRGGQTNRLTALYVARLLRVIEVLQYLAPTRKHDSVNTIHANTCFQRLSSIHLHFSTLSCYATVPMLLLYVTAVRLL